MPHRLPLRWLFATPPDRRLLPGGRLDGPTAWLIAIMMFVMMIVAAAGLALGNGAAVLRGSLADRYTIQIADGAAKAPAALAAARSAPGVASVAEVPEAELRALVERWLGPVAAADSNLPLPVLIDLTLAPNADPAAIGAVVGRAAPGARLVAHADRVAPMLSALTALTWLAAILVALIAGATGAAVVLATRGALDTHRATIEVMHGIGATDLQVTRLFQRKIALDALAGGLAGGAAAAVALLIVASGGAASAGQLAGGQLLGLGDLALLALLPLAGAVLATLVARTTVLKALRSRL